MQKRVLTIGSYCAKNPQFSFLAKLIDVIFKSNPMINKNFNNFYFAA